MVAILAIDAAWTGTAPSGVAVVCNDGAGWCCKGVAPSYEAFVALSGGEAVNWSQPSYRGSVPDAGAILAAASRLLGSRVDLITIDMPVATIPIVGRRAADDAVSVEFGGRWCSAHTPSRSRPGVLGADISRAFERCGYSLATATSAPSFPALIEVYPHPALLSLMKRPRRLPYKVSKSRRYWPDSAIPKRIVELVRIFTEIREALMMNFCSVEMPLPAPAGIDSLASLKRYEDALDTLICAWVGVRFQEGRCVPLGDHTAAIWCPADVVFS